MGETRCAITRECPSRRSHCSGVRATANVERDRRLAHAVHTRPKHAAGGGAVCSIRRGRHICRSARRPQCRRTANEPHQPKGAHGRFNRDSVSRRWFVSVRPAARSAGPSSLDSRPRYVRQHRMHRRALGRAAMFGRHSRLSAGHRRLVCVLLCRYTDFRRHAAFRGRSRATAASGLVGRHLVCRGEARRRLRRKHG